MTGPFAAHAVPTDTVPTRWRPPLADSEFDRPHELLAEGAEALKALSPLEMRPTVPVASRAGLPGAGRRWKAPDRLVDPLYAVRTVLHHVDDVR